MRHYVIANPLARNGRACQQLEQLRKELQRQNVRHEFALCPDLENACELSRKANLTGVDAITAVGGDGTINRVLNGFYDDSGHRLSRACMGAVHLGTSPDFCRSYGVPTEIGRAVAALKAGRVRPISVGRVLFEGTGQHAAYFACCANIGFGASLARLANGGVRQRLGDRLGTFVSLLRVLRQYRPQKIEAELDGHARVLSGVYNVAIGKTFYVASGLKVRNELSSADSRFYVLCLQNLSWRTIPGVLRRLYGGRPMRSDSCLTFEYARRIRLAPLEGPAEVEFDGDPAGRCPCQIETAAEPLDLIGNALSHPMGEGARRAGEGRYEVGVC
jgi:diacylglycerol kinase family enzyme